METACGAIVSRVAELGLGYCRNRFAAVPRKLRTLTNGYFAGAAGGIRRVQENEMPGSAGGPGAGVDSGRHALPSWLSTGLLCQVGKDSPALCPGRVLPTCAPHHGFALKS
jgi:hypothetical protein